jgi:hypothetical protein
MRLKTDHTIKETVMTLEEQEMVDQLGGGGEKKLRSIRNAVGQIELQISDHQEALEYFKTVCLVGRACESMSIDEAIENCQMADEMIERCRMYIALMIPLSYPEDRKRKYLEFYSELMNVCFDIQSIFSEEALSEN